MNTTTITTHEAAEIIGVNDSRVRQLLRAGKLKGERWGRDWHVTRASAESYRDSDRTPGRKPSGKGKRKRKKAA